MKIKMNIIITKNKVFYKNAEMSYIFTFHTINNVSTAYYYTFKE